MSLSADYVEKLIDSGDYRSNNEVLRESLRLLPEKQAVATAITSAPDA